MVDIGFENFDPENPNNGVKPGKVQILIQSVTEVEGHIDVDYEIVAAEDPKELGKTNRERLFKSPKAMIRIAAFAAAVGLTTWDKLTAAKKSGAKKASINIEDAQGKTCLAELVKGEKYVNVAFSGFHHLTDPKCGPEWPRAKGDVTSRQPAEEVAF